MDPSMHPFGQALPLEQQPMAFTHMMPINIGSPLHHPPNVYNDPFMRPVRENSPSPVLHGSPTSPWGNAFGAPLPPISVGLPPNISVLPPISVGSPLHLNGGNPMHPTISVGSPGPSPPRIRMPQQTQNTSPIQTRMSPRRTAPLTGLPGCISQAHKILNTLDEDFQMAASKILHMQRTNPVLTAQVLAQLAYACALNKPQTSGCYAQFVVHVRAWIKESERGAFEKEVFTIVKDNVDKLLPTVATWGTAEMRQHAKVLVGSMQFLGELFVEGLIPTENIEEVLNESWPPSGAGAMECAIRVKMICTLLGIIMVCYDKPLLRQRLVGLKRLTEGKPNHLIDVLVEKLLEDARHKVPWFGVAGIPNPTPTQAANGVPNAEMGSRTVGSPRTPSMPTVPLTWQERHVQQLQPSEPPPTAAGTMVSAAAAAVVPPRSTHSPSEPFQVPPPQWPHREVSSNAFDSSSAGLPFGVPSMHVPADCMPEQLGDFSEERGEMGYPSAFAKPSPSWDQLNPSGPSEGYQWLSDTSMSQTYDTPAAAEDQYDEPLQAQYDASLPTQYDEPLQTQPVLDED